MVNSLQEEVYASEATINWVSGKFMFNLFGCCAFKAYPDFTQRCLASPEIKGDATFKAARNDEVPAFHLTLSTPSPLLIEWARAKLTNSSWKDALTSAVHVGIFLCTDTFRGPDARLICSLWLRDS